MNTVALIVAAGQGLRFGGDIPKQFRNIGETPLLGWTVSQFEKANSVDEIILVVAEDFLLYANDKIGNNGNFRKLSRIISGGETRRDSVFRGLKSLPISTGFVAIHDGARPVISCQDIDHVVDTAQKERAAILARPIAETVKRSETGFILSTLDRSKLFLAETPQVFQYDLIMAAHKEYPSEKEATDDASMVEALGFKVKIVIPEKPNIKVTTENDLKIAKMFLEINNET